MRGGGGGGEGESREQLGALCVGSLPVLEISMAVSAKVEKSTFRNSQGMS